MTRLLTVEEVAERLGVTKDWVWAQARAGRIPHVQLGRYRRFREEALERWLTDLELRAGEGQREQRIEHPRHDVTADPVFLPLGPARGSWATGSSSSAIRVTSSTS